MIQKRTQFLHAATGLGKVEVRLNEVGVEGELLTSNLSTEQEQQLRAAFGTAR